MVVTGANQLLTFRANTSATIISMKAITGLGADSLVAVDFRPATRQLYALGSMSHLYIIDMETNAATAVGAAGAFNLSGTAFGFDVHPMVDRIRVVSDAGQNLRLKPNDGTLSAIDSALNPGTPQIVAAAYNNNFVGAIDNTLYVIDVVSDTLMIQNPPNAGTLSVVGALGVDAARASFDITATGQAFAVLSLPPGTTSGLYTIDLSTGAATLVGAIGSSAYIVGMAVAP